MSDKKSKTQWHVMLGTMLEYLLTPVGIQVQIEVPIASEPPKADVILLRRETPRWTEEQRELLPDGQVIANTNLCLFMIICALWILN